jgi:hypothetical protein
MPLMGLDALQSIICAAVAGLSGYRLPTSDSLISSGPAWVFPAAPAPVLLRKRVHPLLSFSSPTECVAAPTLSGTRERQTPVLGFVPHRDINSQSPLMGRAPTLHHLVPPAAFHTPSTVCSSARLAGLFHPAATSWVHTPGVSVRRPAEPPRW